MKFKIDVLPKKIKCKHCGKKDGIIKFYIPVNHDGMPIPYHPQCYKKLQAKNKKNEKI